MTSDGPRASRIPGHALRCAALAALVYLGLALLVVAPALRAPTRLLPYLAALDAPGKSVRIARLDHRDQKMVVSVVARNAHVLTSRPWRLFGDGQCYPMPRGYTLGEHMFGLGFLAAVPWALAGDPILAFNVALVLTLWVAGIAMYALAFHFTTHPGAAFVAGLLFELAPKRITGSSHPYVHGDLWTPLALLFLHRVFVRGGFGNALACSAFATLALCESLYPIVAFGILLAVYVPYLCVRHRDRLLGIVPQLALCAACLLVAAWLIFGPYLETRAAWDVLSGRDATLLTVRAYLPGRLGFPGYLTTALVLLALVDRVRRARPVDGEDPRLAYLAGGLLIMGVTIGRWSIPLLGLDLPSPLVALRGWVPGLDAVRALPAIGIGAGLPLAFLAGYGALAVLEHVGRRGMAALLTGVVAVVLATRFVPALARPTFGYPSLSLAGFDARPPEEDVALVRRAASGALLDVPFPWTGARRLGMSDDLLRASYAGHPTAACYNSFVSPVQRQVGALADALPGRDAADALAALGFRTVLLEKAQLLPRDRQRFFLELRAQPPGEQRLERLGETQHLVAYRLASPAPLVRDFALLAAGAAEDPDAAVEHRTAGDAPLSLSFRNGGDATFRHPDPIVPSELLVRWTTATGVVALEQQVRELLPIALAAGARMEIPLHVSAPPAAGRYTVTVARADDPSTVLARRAVDLAGGTATSAPQSR